MQSFKKQLHRALLLIILSGVWASTTTWANNRDSLQKAHVEASVKLLNRAVTHNILKARTTAPKYLIDRLNYVSADTKAKIEQLQDLLKKQTGKELYVIITRSPDMLEEQNAATKFNQETKDFTDKVHTQSMVDENTVLLTINFVKSVKGKKVGIKTSYLQSTGIAVGNSLAQHKITENDFRTDLQTKATNLPTKDDYARALIYRVHQSLGGFAPEVALHNPSPELIAKYEEVLNAGNAGQAGAWANAKVIEVPDDQLVESLTITQENYDGVMTPSGKAISVSDMQKESLQFWLNCNGSLKKFTAKNGKKYVALIKPVANNASCGSGAEFLGYYIEGLAEEHVKLSKQNPSMFPLWVRKNGRIILNPVLFKPDNWFATQNIILGKNKRLRSRQYRKPYLNSEYINSSDMSGFWSLLKDLKVVKTVCYEDIYWNNELARPSNPSNIRGVVNPHNFDVQSSRTTVKQTGCEFDKLLAKTKNIQPRLEAGWGMLLYFKYAKVSRVNKQQLVKFANLLTTTIGKDENLNLINFEQKFDGTNAHHLNGKAYHIIKEILKEGYTSETELAKKYTTLPGKIRDAFSDKTYTVWATKTLTVPQGYNRYSKDYTNKLPKYQYSIQDLIVRHQYIAQHHTILSPGIVKAEKAGKAFPLSSPDVKTQYEALFGTNAAVFNWMRYVFPELEPMTLRISVLKSSRKILFRTGVKKNFSNLTADELADIVKNVKKDGLLIRIINKLKPVIQKIAAKAQKVKGLVVFFDKAKGILSINKVSKIKGGFAFVPQLKVFVNQGQRIEVAAKAVRQQINGVVSATQQLAQTTAIKIKETSKVLTGKVEVVFTQGKVQVREHLAFLTQTLKVKPEVVNRLRKLPANMVSVTRNASEVLIQDLAKATIARIKQGKVTVLRWVDVSKQKVKDLREIADGKFLARRKSSGNVGVCLRDGTCFVAGTLIFEAKTLRPIETIQPEDKVHSGNPQNCTQALKSVKATFVRTTPVLVKLDFPLEAIYATPEHPFFDLHNQQVLAGNLKAGDTLKTYDGYAIVQNTRSIDTTATVYNFHVSDFHTYYVGKSKLWVHNMMSHENVLSIKVSDDLLDKLPIIKVHRQNVAVQVGDEFGAIDVKIKGDKIYEVKANGTETLLNGQKDFIVTMGGELKVGTGHYFLSNSSETVKAAGQIKVLNGRIKMVTNGSGHYRPDAQALKSQKKLFDDLGLTEPNCKVWDLKWAPKADVVAEVFSIELKLANKLVELKKFKDFFEKAEDILKPLTQSEKKVFLADLLKTTSSKSNIGDVLKKIDIETVKSWKVLSSKQTLRVLLKYLKTATNVKRKFTYMGKTGVQELSKLLRGQTNINSQKFLNNLEVALMKFEDVPGLRFTGIQASTECRIFGGKILLGKVNDGDLLPGSLIPAWKKLKKSGYSTNQITLEMLEKAWLKLEGISSKHLARIERFGDEAPRVYKVLQTELKSGKITVKQLSDKEVAEKWFEKQELNYLWGLKNQMSMLLKKKVKHWQRMKKELGIKLSYQILKMNKYTRGNRNCVYCSLSTDYLFKGGELKPVKFNPPKGTNTSSKYSEKWFGKNYPQNATPIAQIRAEMIKSGDGATGIVSCKFNSTGTGHLLNVVNKKGKVWIVDTQGLNREYLLTLEEFEKRFYYIFLINTTGIPKKMPPTKMF